MPGEHIYGIPSHSELAELLISALSLKAFLPELAERIERFVVEPLRRETAPDQAVLEECACTVNQYKAIANACTAAGIPPDINLDAMILALQNRIAPARWKEYRSAAIQLLRDVGGVSHKSGTDPQYLLNLRDQISATLAELEVATQDAEIPEWERRLQPFYQLWWYLTNLDSVSENECDTTLSLIEARFGRQLMLAVATQKLNIKSHFTTQHEHTNVEESNDPYAGGQHSSNDDSPPSPSNADSSIDLKYTEKEDPQSPLIDTVPPEPESAFPLTSPPYDAQLPPSLDGALRKLNADVWRLLGSGRAGLAYHLANVSKFSDTTQQVESPALFRSAALAPFVRSSFGEVVDQFRVCIADLIAIAGLQGQGDEVATARRLTLFGLSLRPTLLAPAAGAASILQSLTTIDSSFPSMGQLRQAIAGFGTANIELSPSVLKGVRDHARWDEQLNAISKHAESWLLSNRQSKIIYAATTDVWHRWLRDDGPIGCTLNHLIKNNRSSRSNIQDVAHRWLDAKHVERQLQATDVAIRGNGARRKPIEARARGEVCSRTREFVQIIARWLEQVDSEPNTLDDYRQQRADEVRAAVAMSLPGALIEIDKAAGGGTYLLESASNFVKASLLDLQQLFDPNHEETQEVPPVKVLLSEELLAIPDIEIDSHWNPHDLKDSKYLKKLLAICDCQYAPETAFVRQADRWNHIRTGQIIEALIVRGRPALADRLQDERNEKLRLCRKDFQQRLAKTRANVEQAVCYDLIGGDDRSRFADIVEGYEAALEDILDFSRATADLQRIDGQIEQRRDSRVEQVQCKLDLLTKEGVPSDRQSDIEVIRVALNRGDFLSAEEYLELVRSGQPLSHISEADRSVFRDFFIGVDGRPGFIRRFDDVMKGSQRLNARDVIDRIRKAESIGPIDMKGVPEPQAREAAKMIEAWLRLKDMKDRAKLLRAELTTLLAGFGFKDVDIQSVDIVKGLHWIAMCQTAELNTPDNCIVPQYGSLARGKYRVLGVYDRPNEESLVELTKECSGSGPLLVLYFGRMTEQRRRDLAEISRSRSRSFLTIDESLVYFLCSERFSRLPIFFQCALPFTVAKPYTTTASLVPIEMFFGRQQEREQVTAIDGTNLVYGGRQLGKSALLRDIERRSHNPPEGQIVRWIDLKNCGIGIHQPTEDIWAEIGRVLHAEGVLSSAATTHDTVARRVKDWLKTDDRRRLLLLLDEADGFLEMDSTASAKGRQSYPEVARLKGLMDDTNRRFKVVFAGLHNVQRAARDPNTPLGHLGTPVCIGPLLENGEWKQARNLIVIPLRHMGYELSPPDLWMRILSYTNYYPSLIQVFCKHLLEHLQNKDRTTFDFRRCPPYPVTAEQIERVYQSRELRDEVSHKFELTLGLDPRYRLIALRIALDSLDNLSGRPDGVDVAWVRAQALDYWAAGFGLDDRGYESFRTILDEMVGLGILRRAGEDRYALRSPNLLNLIGSKSQIENKLEDVMARPPAPVYIATAFRRSLGRDLWDHSPLTAEQEATLTEDENGVVTVFASRLAGLDRLNDGLKAIPNVAGVVVSPRLSQPIQFEKWLRQVDEERGPHAEGVTLAVVDSSSSWTPSWIRHAVELLGKKTSSRKRFLRVIFVADPPAAWEFSAAEDTASLGATEITLRPWHEAALIRWTAEAELGDPHRVCEEIRSRLGGWFKLVSEFAANCRDQLHSWQVAMDHVTTDWPNNLKWVRCCDMPFEAAAILSIMAQYNDAIHVPDLQMLAGTDPTRVILWADRFAFIQRADDDSGERWILDPIIRDYVLQGGK